MDFPVQPFALQRSDLHYIVPEVLLSRVVAAQHALAPRVAFRDDRSTSIGRIMSNRITRRQFLSGTISTAAALTTTRLLRGVPAGYSANEKVNVAQIGTTGKGAADLRGITKAGGNIVALCD